MRLSLSSTSIPQHILMTTLLESRTQHRRSQVLSRRACEAEVHNQDPPNRCLPVIFADSVPTNICTGNLTTCQCSQRHCWELEKEIQSVEEMIDNEEESANVCASNIFTHSPVSENVIGQSSTHHQRQQAQRVRRENERLQPAAKRRKHDNCVRVVCLYFVTHHFTY